MKTLLSGVSVLLMSGLTFSEVSLNLSPNRLQFFSGDSVSLSCVEGGQTVDGTVRRTRGGTTDRCGPAGSDFGLFQDSSCVLDLLSSYTGLYWCETSSGRSDRVQISVFHREEFPFILEIPAHPVTAGSDVTLRCRNKDGSLRAAYFLKNNAATGDGLKVQELSIRAVQRSDEGLYSCSTDVSEPSPQSWLRVRDPTGTSAPPSTSFHSSAVTDPSCSPSASPPPPPPPSPPPPPPPCVSPVRLVLHLLSFSLYCFCTGLLVSICCSRRMEDQLVVSMTMSRVGGASLEEEDHYVLVHGAEEQLHPR